ncbi:Dabb family protein [Paenibacillus sp. TAB 01]|uniref:Dabb family protein n=1 Tax=Paenibacillus sp. TAB 01 TaxID=3368988 RepID=UPI0037506E89
MNLGSKLKQLRQRQDITLRKLGEKAGVSYSIMNAIENGRFQPSADVIRSLANVLQYDEVEELLRLAEAPAEGMTGTNQKLKEKGQEAGMNPNIAHTVFFKLRFPAQSEEAQAFLTSSAATLTEVPNVLRFQVLKQQSGKNPYEYGFYMEFASQADYEAYNSHPVHVQYVEEVWKRDVTDFLEIDYTIIAAPGE